MAFNLLDMQAVAEKMGLSYETIRGYHGVATRRRRDGDVRPGDMPEPDDFFGQSPVWSESTIEAWRHHRPGKGVGGGRPRKDAKE